MPPKGTGRRQKKLKLEESEPEEDFLFHGMDGANPEAGQEEGSGIDGEIECVSASGDRRVDVLASSSATREEPLSGQQQYCYATWRG